MSGRYGAEHRRLRKALLPEAWGKPCARCGGILREGEEVDFDHNDDGRGYRGFAHAHCNRSVGGQIGRQRQIAALEAEKRRRRMNIVEAVLGVEISEDRRKTAIGVAARANDEQAIVLELVAYLDGTTSGEGEIRRLVAELPVRSIVIDPHSPAATLIRPLSDDPLGVQLVQPSTSDVVVAHGAFIDALNAGQLRHVPHPALDAAARAGQQRRLGGAQAWDRRTPEVDVSPLTAVTLAAWGLTFGPPSQPPVEPFGFWA